jgi:hypothetical protein
MNDIEKVFRDIRIKYKDYFPSLNDLMDIGSEVIYFPEWNGMIYALYDNTYDYFKFKPGDVMTIKEVKQIRPGQTYHPILVEENNCTFTPAEFVPKERVSENDIQLVKQIFEEKYKEKLGKGTGPKTVAGQNK